MNKLTFTWPVAATVIAVVAMVLALFVWLIDRGYVAGAAIGAPLIGLAGAGIAWVTAYLNGRAKYEQGRSEIPPLLLDPAAQAILRKMPPAPRAPSIPDIPVDDVPPATTTSLGGKP